MVRHCLKGKSGRQARIPVILHPPSRENISRLRCERMLCLKNERLSVRTCLLLILLLMGTMLLCVCVGSVFIPPLDTCTALWNTLWGLEVPAGISRNIILNIRLPRVLNVALVGAALSLSGAAMQGLLRNPLADGSTLGVSSGASLGAVLALAFGVQLPGTAYGGVMAMAMLFAFLSLLLILSLAYALDRSLSTNSIILIGVICIVPLTPILEVPVLTPAFEQMLPALFGGLGVAFVSKNWKIAIAPVALMLVLFIFVPALNAGTVGIMVPVSVLFTIAVARILYRKGVL